MIFGRGDVRADRRPSGQLRPSLRPGRRSLAPDRILQSGEVTNGALHRTILRVGSAAHIGLTSGWPSMEVHVRSLWTSSLLSVIPAVDPVRRGWSRSPLGKVHVDAAIERLGRVEGPSDPPRRSPGTSREAPRTASHSPDIARTDQRHLTCCEVQTVVGSQRPVRIVCAGGGPPIGSVRRSRTSGKYVSRRTWGFESLSSVIKALACGVE